MLNSLKLKELDTSFSFTSDCSYWNGFWNGKNEFGNIGCDPDICSPALRKYHQTLWNKTLPNGKIFSLEFGKKSDYLKFQDMRFASDSIITSFRYKKNTKLLHEVIKNIDWKTFIENFLYENYTIGGTIIFPKHKNSINGQRGMNSYICDRFDLTLECIRRYYLGITDKINNPLGWVLESDKNFFDLFIDFKGYCEFFFLQDCLFENLTSVKMWIPTIPFAEKYPLPKNVEEYMLWIDESRKFVQKRNVRISEYIKNTD